MTHDGSFAPLASARGLLVLAATSLAACALAPSAARAQDGSGWIDTLIASGGSAQTSSDTDAQKPATRRRAAAARARPARVRETDTESKSEVRSAALSGSLSGGGITWQASSGCVPGALRGVLAELVGTFGPITVTSTCRSGSQNRAAGGAGQSYHLSGQAVDFRVHGSTGSVYAYLSGNGSVGGLKHYGGGLFHIDTGPRRSW